MLIYKHTNKINGKSYIGQTSKTMEVRFEQHVKSKNSNSHFHRALRKYGRENFESEILECNIETIELSNGREIFWIEYYDSIENGYNMVPGGGCSPGQALKGKTYEEFYGPEIAKEMKENISSHTAGRTYEEMYGEEGSKEKRLKMSKSRTGIKMNEEQKKNLRENHWSTKGVKNDWSVQPPHSEETKNKITESLNKTWDKIRGDEEKYGEYLKKRNEKIECPHCGKMSDRANAGRWHFENCKHKKGNDEN